MVTLSETLLRMVSDDYRKEIGQVAVQWSLLEGVVENCIWQAAGLRYDLGRVMTSQTMMLARLDLLGALLHQTHPHFADPFEKVARYISECLVGRRNLVIHALWTQTDLPPDIGSSHKFSSRGRLVWQGGFVNKSELIQLSNDIADTTVWVTQLADALPALIEVPGELGHATRDPRTPQEFATRKQRALQPLPPPAKAEAPQ